MTSGGAKANSIDRIRDGVIGRGVLLDLPRAQRREWLDDGTPILPEHLDACAEAQGVTVDAGFIHCAKAFRRGVMWEPDKWPDATSNPSPGQMVVDHAEITEITGDQLDDLLEAGYAEDLAADLPE